MVRRSASRLAERGRALSTLGFDDFVLLRVTKVKRLHIGEIYHMTDTQKRFLELAKFAEELSTKAKETNEAIASVMQELGVGTYVQDPETTTVYKVVKPKGKFQFYQDIDYVRTAQGDEKQGGLSKKEAAEQGFEVKK
jgi:hypothetical protein